MKKTAIAAAIVLVSAFSPVLKGQEIKKTGYNFGPLPIVAYDADKGFQYGGMLQLFDYGDGSSYPNYKTKYCAEVSFFTKGSSYFNIMSDYKELIPGVRWSSALLVNIDKAMDFYGFNGYRSYLDYSAIEAGKNGDNYIFTPYYRLSRKFGTLKTDFIGGITRNLKWELGYHAGYYSMASIDRTSINKKKDESQMYPDSAPTLYDQYLDWGLISEDEAGGGFVSSIRAGLVYDSRDKEGAPTRGIWAEAHVTAAPGFLGTKNPFTRYSMTWRHYLPIVRHDVLTFAYRLNYEGTIGKNAPYYVLPFITVMGENTDKDGMGGYRTARGLLRDRVLGLDMATYIAELRWRFARFSAFNQNIALGLSVFSDGSMVTRERPMAQADDLEGYTRQGGRPDCYPSYKEYLQKSAFDSDRLHISTGAGFRFIMNENFIVAVEYGMSIANMVADTNAKYRQDGGGAFYVNVGYLF